MARAAVIAAATLAAMLPSSASAATVSLQEVRYCVDVWTSCRYMDYSLGVVLVYAGEGEERNAVSVKRSGASIAVVDAAAPLRAGPSCVATGATSARCDPGRPLVGYRLDGGFGADTIRVVDALSPAPAFRQPHVLSGGRGDDVLLDGADDSVLLGGPGGDRLSGGDGADRFFHDTPSLSYPPSAGDNDGAEHDVVDGGPGFDTADYKQRTRSLRMRVGRRSATGGEPGENDRLRRVERIIGGRGDDVLLGGPGDDRLDGFAGDDRIEGGGGADELIGGKGSDTLVGGGGADRLGSGEHTTCGRGHDIIGNLEVDWMGTNVWTGPSAGAVLARDCEEVRWGVPGRHNVSSLDPRPVRRGRRQWAFRNPCARTTIVKCKGVLTLSLPGEAAPLAVAAFHKTGLVRARLGAPAARRLARARAVTLRYEVPAAGPLEPFVISAR